MVTHGSAASAQRQRSVSAASASVPVTSSIIQCSVVGPLLFDAFINDILEQVTTCDVILCTDNSKAVGASADEREHRLVQRDLDMIGLWSEDNHLPLNTDKCMCMHYGHHNTKLSYFINGVPIKDTK